MAKPRARNGEIVDGRYRLGDALGGGGMAAVYEATELHSGRRLALKQLHVQEEPNRQRRSQELFEHEFHTLVELAHPRIVRVYDYASTESGTYYTMELLDGGDLQQLVPVPWQRACTFARDICFALSIVHSRRLVYRDLSPRNVRCTTDGIAKLIDFGALALAGQRPQVIVGTPAFCAPETVRLQILDARTDLYSLGATLYFALTGAHPYLGGDFDSIEFAWHTPPVPPRELVPELPAALERLVLDLLQLESDARPASAVEVIERLCAIDGTPIDETLLFANVDLATPRLVGREETLGYARAKLSRAFKGRGNALLFDGPSGVGRSRLLEACVLSAKLEGATVLHSNADAVTLGEYGVLRSLARAALEVYSADAVELARPVLGVLGHALPELHRRVPEIALQSFESSAAHRAALQPALRTWLFGLSRLRPLVIAVDDLQGVDEPSAAALAVLAHDLSSERIAMLMTLDSRVATRAPAAVELISQTARRISLEPLGPDATLALLASIFGDVPHLASLAHRSHEIARGNPRDLMRLARHLVDQKQIRYHAGAWALPERFDETNLPSSIVVTLQARLARLDADALDLARAFALEPSLRLDFEACLVLTEHAHAGRLMSSLTALVQEEVVRPIHEQYVLAQAAWPALLLSDASAETVRGLHRRLARLAQRSGADEVRIARHGLLAGDAALAIQVLVVDGEAAHEKLRGDPEAFLRYARALPPDWLQLHGELLALCDAQGRPLDAYKLRSRIGAFVALMGIREDVHGPRLLAQLTELSGLADYNALPAELAPLDRLRRALETAKARYDACPEPLRVVDPLTAVRQLGRLSVQLAGSYVATLDVPACRALPDVAPLAVLSPAFDVIAKLVEGTFARIRGINARFRVVMREVLERTAQPDRAGLDPSYHHYARLVVMSGLGIVEAGMGLASSLEWAAAIESDPTAQVKALEIQMLYHLWQGNAREAARCKGRAEVLQIQNNPREWAKGVHLPWQAAAYAACDDLTHTKRALDEIAPFAERFPGWEPVECYARGEYERLRGDHAAALRHVQRGLSLTAAGEHQAWVHLAGAELRVLLALGRSAEALANGRTYAAAAARAGLAQLEVFVQLPLALAQAEAGEGPEAIRACDDVLASLTAAGTTGLLLGLVHETRALVADTLGDSAGAHDSSAHAVRIYRAHANPALSAKSERLKFDLQRRAPRSAAHRNEATSLTRVALVLASCRDIRARARTALDLMSQQSGAEPGGVFLIGPQGPYCAFESPSSPLPSEIHRLAAAYLESQLADADSTADDSEQVSRQSTLWQEDTASYRPVLLSHEILGGFAVTGVVVLVASDPEAFRTPYRIATELSQQFQQFGDATAMIVAY